jgi:hypothetical protein
VVAASECKSGVHLRQIIAAMNATWESKKNRFYAQNSLYLIQKGVEKQLVVRYNIIRTQELNGQ